MAPRKPITAPLTPSSAPGNGHRRSRTLSIKAMQRQIAVEPADPVLAAELERTRPRTRADCEGTARPCLHLSCRHHLYLDINQDTGSIKFNFPGKDVDEIGATCALDVADRGGVTLEEIGSIMNVTRERVRQMEGRALERVRGLGLAEG